MLGVIYMRRLNKKNESLTNIILSALKKAVQIGTLGAVTLSPIGCMTPEEYVSRRFLNSKEYVQKKMHYDKHSDDPSVKDQDLYILLGFSGQDIVSEQKYGKIKVVKIRQGCGKPGHSENCVQKELLSPYGLSDVQGNCDVFIDDKILHIVLPGDNTPVVSISYISNERKLRVVDYCSAVEYGKVKKPLPENFDPNVGGMGNLSDSRIAELHKFLIGHFGASIFDEEDAFLAEYNINPEEKLDELTSILKNYVNNDKNILEDRASKLLGVAEKYKRMNKEGKKPKRIGVKLAEFSTSIEKIYNTLEKEANIRNDENIKSTLGEINDYLSK